MVKISDLGSKTSSEVSHQISDQGRFKSPACQKTHCFQSVLLIITSKACQFLLRKWFNAFEVFFLLYFIQCFANQCRGYPFLAQFESDFDSSPAKVPELASCKCPGKAFFINITLFEKEVQNQFSCCRINFPNLEFQFDFTYTPFLFGAVVGGLPQ